MFFREEKHIISRRHDVVISTDVGCNVKNEVIPPMCEIIGEIVHLVGGWTNPFEKNESKWESSPSRGENKQYLKPPPSHHFRIILLTILKLHGCHFEFAPVNSHLLLLECSVFSKLVQYSYNVHRRSLGVGLWSSYMSCGSRMIITPRNAPSRRILGLLRERQHTQGGSDDWWWYTFANFATIIPRKGSIT